MSYTWKSYPNTGDLNFESTARDALTTNKENMDGTGEDPHGMDERLDALDGGKSNTPGFQSNSIPGNSIELSSTGTGIDTAQIEDLAVTGAKIENGAVDFYKLENSCVNSEKLITSNGPTYEYVLAYDTSGEMKWVAATSLISNLPGTAIQDALTGTGIDTAQIEDSSVTLAKMADESVGADQYVNGSIYSVHLTGGSVNNSILAANAVSYTKISTLNNATDGQVLSYNSGSLQWIDGGTGGTGGTGLEYVSDDGTNFGWKLIDRIDGFDANIIGEYAVDFSSNTSAVPQGAEGKNSLAVGYQAYAKEGDSIAIGYSCKSLCVGGVSIGLGCIVNIGTLYAAAAIGHNCTSVEGAFACGTFNIGTSTTTRLEVGMGTSDAARENALEVHSDGSIVIPNMPTSSAGLAVGTLWNNAGTVDTNLAPAAGSSYEQVYNDAINGSFKVWQRGTDITVSGAGSIEYGPDRLSATIANASGSIRMLQSIESDRYACAITQSESTDTLKYTMLNIDALKYGGGHKVVFQIDIKTSSGVSIVQNITDFDGSTGGVYGSSTTTVPVDGQWHTLTLISSSITSVVHDLVFSISATTSSAAYTISNLRIYKGDVEREVKIKTENEELRNCQGYYQVINTNTPVSAWGEDVDILGISLQFITPMVSTPVLVTQGELYIYGGGSIYTTTTLSIFSVNEQAVKLTTGVSGIIKRNSYSCTLHVAYTFDAEIY